MDKQKVAKRLALIHSHPKYFLKYCVFTKDQNDTDNPCKPFPFHHEFHQRNLDLWFNHNKYICLKSRQMQQSWLMLAAHLWLALTGRDRDIYIRRQKWDDALKLLERTRYIYDHIPADVWPTELLPELTYKEGQISFPQLNSQIYAMASGKDQGRGETPTALLIDEFAFQEDDELAYATLAPALQGNARVSLVSTPCPLFGKRDPYHRRIYEDRLGLGYEDYAIEHNKELEALEPLTGYREWVNEGNGFACAEIYYTADPAKRTPEWKTRIQSQMSTKAWLTEFELSWETYTGEAVFGTEFNKHTHVAAKRIKPNPDYPIIRGWDFGGNHSCIITQYIDEKLYVIDEFPNMGYNTRTIASDIQQTCHKRYGEDYFYVDVIDPSGMWEGKTSTGKACGDVMRDLGMRLVPGIQDPTRRIDSIMRLLIENRLIINASCDMLIRGFQGGFHYPEKETQNQKYNRPVKNEFSHPMDGLCYIGTRLGDRSLFYQPKITTVSGGGYKFA